MNTTPQIRPIAIAAIRRGDDILVFEGHDATKQETYYRPLGGGIEFGESAVEAVQRELREELDVGLSDVELLGVVENIFAAFGRAGHEIVFVYSANLADLSMYDRDAVGHIKDEGSPVSWQPLSRFTSGEAVLYPRGLVALLPAATPTQ
ncbi:NUDIX domain-containing protein [Micromonospora phytophila]|uniref:NUDIX hydrolase n=1 Tax=Micromonospora phytophila TaxID=709888 RepID=UPI0020305167|nr:NUDIX domain-containing protein [Micromonospora phytophila]MCM0674103.1 NUDIX domain-containing protein [Micromonospora phytophila]